MEAIIDVRVSRSQIATAATIGALAGASLHARRGARSSVGAALMGAMIVGVSEAIARQRQRPNEIPGLWHRILTSTALAAPIGWIADVLGRPQPTITGLTAGGVAGATLLVANPNLLYIQSTPMTEPLLLAAALLSLAVIGDWLNRGAARGLDGGPHARPPRQ